ncbi:MAG: rRNA adenine N-6-methyltransferase family protein [Candidatus ainarchaeum sp.]|nr:rRNA adenine N-6-methyltransferase family protein [Candidatus ainarchaeum sp.]
MSLFNELQDLMIKYHFRPEKKLSQFFCINEALLIFLVNSAKLKKSDVVLEIGPGTGFLTKKLLEKCRVVAVEKDETMIELLKKEFEKEIKEKKLVLINGNILEQNFEELNINKIVSLPPYHISSDLLEKIVLSKIELVILVLDSGFVEKITAFEGMKEYGFLTIIINLNSKISVLEKISKESFFPIPNCLSEVVKIVFDNKENSKEFLIFAKELFRHKNKDLSRALKQAKPFLEKKMLLKKIDFNNIILGNKKVYLLTPEEMLKIFKIFVKNNN